MTAMFLTDLVVEVKADKQFELIKTLIYASDIGVNGVYTIIVPAGFVTDFASVPRLPFAYLLAGGVAHKAAVVHDFLYETATGTKEEADKIFLEAMTVLGIPAWRRNLMYAAVRIGGRGNFDKIGKTV
jgi:hypothetical protein